MILKMLGLFLLILSGFSAYDIIFVTNDYLWLIVSFILFILAVKLFRTE